MRSLFFLLSFFLANPVWGGEGIPDGSFSMASYFPSHAMRGTSSEPVLPRYKFNTTLGLTACGGSALDAAFQFGYAPFPRPFYVGPELNFSLFSTGSILGTLFTAWYELYLTKDQKLSLIGGLAGGPGFSTQLPGVRTTTSMIFIEGTISEELDDLVSVRGQIRPGMIGDVLAFMVNFGFSFRFY